MLGAAPSLIRMRSTRDKGVSGCVSKQGGVVRVGSLQTTAEDGVEILHRNCRQRI